MFSKYLYSLNTFLMHPSRSQNYNSQCRHTRTETEFLCWQYMVLVVMCRADRCRSNAGHIIRVF